MMHEFLENLFLNNHHQFNIGVWYDTRLNRTVHITKVPGDTRVVYIPCEINLGTVVRSACTSRGEMLTAELCDALLFLLSYYTFTF